MIRNATYNDAAAITEIYNYYVLNTAFTFEEAPVSPDEMQRRITDVQIRFPWLVFEENGLIIGYAYACHGSQEPPIAILLNHQFIFSLPILAKVLAGYFIAS